MPSAASVWLSRRAFEYGTTLSFAPWARIVGGELRVTRNAGEAAWSAEVLVDRVPRHLHTEELAEREREQKRQGLFISISLPVP
jgi:hypothetical protein